MLQSLAEMEWRNGYLEINDASDDDFLTIATRLGTIWRDGSGYAIKHSEVMSAASARPNTLSSIHGTGSFPLHTDCAFWKVPPRYLVMRAQGDFRRPTRILDVARLHAAMGAEHVATMRRALWSVCVDGTQIYTSSHFVFQDQVGLRLDLGCMTPVNAAAKKAVEVISDVAVACRIEVTWRQGLVIVLDNWLCLHGRGEEPVNEDKRILERIYVR